MVFTDNFIIPTTTTTTSPPSHEPDDISAFLRHLLHRSTTTTTTTSSPSQPFLPTLPSISTLGTHAGDHNIPLPSFSSGSPGLFPRPNRHSLDHLNAVVLPSSSPLGYFPVSGGPHLSSNNEFTEDCDYESEEAAEVTAEEEEARRSMSRNQSKRTRAAEVHNLSEKRRRSRINEKMKALQNLIPNSNKTDKASMLDEAIEYLKQLQLQVQMLSMRNGLSLHPMCLPEEQGIMHATQLSGIGMHNLSNTNASFDQISMLPNASHSTFNLANRQPRSSTRPSLTSISNVISPVVPPFGPDSRVQPSFRPFQPEHPQRGCREQSLPREQLPIDKLEMKSLVTTTPLSFCAGNSSVERHHHSLEAPAQTKYGSEELLLENILGQDQSTSGILSGFHATSSSAGNDKLTIGRR
ncbi:hypothetical protein RND81_06G034300 [Saponaria officinalis]|uniref:BHLH domain-containing protein n=1 Tax=Saponaria officinalis TaxID=3572 RepID=A0AAW1K664_SAPOF